MAELIIKLIKEKSELHFDAEDVEYFYLNKHKSCYLLKIKDEEHELYFPYDTVSGFMCLADLLCSYYMFEHIKADVYDEQCYVYRDMYCDDILDDVLSHDTILSQTVVKCVMPVSENKVAIQLLGNILH